jgi:AcrR family transcriptional regulator
LFDFVVNYVGHLDCRPVSQHTSFNGWKQTDMRKDAERNREKLIVAASAIMRSEGADVPMEIIAERASLTRGTLYRNFPHRQAMYEAVLEHDLETMTKQLASDRNKDPLAFIRRMTELMMVYDKFLISLADMPDYDAEKNQERMVAIITEPLVAAQTRGVLNADLTGDDILMACRMLASHWRLDNQPDPARAFNKRFELILRGLRPDTVLQKPGAKNSVIGIRRPMPSKRR